MTELEALRRQIATRFTLVPVPGIPEIRLYTAGPSSRLGRLAGGSAAAPYWAYHWSGGAVLAHYLLDRPEVARGRRVLDLGAGGGVVAIAAALAGAAVTASEIDANGVEALRLNLEANNVAATIVGDLTEASPPAVDVVTAGDVFYGPQVAARMLSFLELCLAAGIEVLIGDPGRMYLPRQRLEPIAEYLVPEVGATRGAALTPAIVYRLR